MHFIVLTGIDNEGKVHVNNPNKTKAEGAFNLESDVNSVANTYFIYEGGSGASGGSSGVAAGFGAEPLSEFIKEKIKGISLPDDATVKPENLAYLSMRYYDFNGNEQVGHMIVNANLASDVLSIFSELYEAKYPIESMNLIDEYYEEAGRNRDNLDYTSIEHNNTSAFCYRSASNSSSMSQHAYGNAIDINPKINPYVNADGSYSHPNASKYVSRSKAGLSEVEKKALITTDSEIYKIFKKHGWTWGGDWQGDKDYQHFQKETELGNTSNLAGQVSSSIPIAEDTGKGLDGFQGSIRIRRITPNKGVGVLASAGVGETSSTKTSSGPIAGDVQTYLNGLDGTWAVYAKKLEGKTAAVNINGDKQMQSASLIKLFIAGTLYQEGKANGSTESLINTMISDSNNESTNQLIEILGDGDAAKGFEKVNAFCADKGYSKTQLGRLMTPRNKEYSGENYTSVEDVAKVLDEIQKNQYVNGEASKKILQYMKNQTHRNKIPAGVPSGVETANKTGELDDVQNDAAIVYKKDANYILVVMSSGVSENNGVTGVVEISKIVYENIDKNKSDDNNKENKSNDNKKSNGKKHTIAVVAGHGDKAGADQGWYTSGTSDNTGVTKNPVWEEKDLTVEVVNYVKQIFKSQYPDFTVVTDGYGKKNEERLQIAKNAGAELFVGVHFNSNDDSGVRGTGVYYEPGTNYVTETVKLANALQTSIMKEMGTPQCEGVTARSYNAFSDGRQNAFGGPALYVEGAFMSNREDMKIIAKENDEGLKAYAKGIVAGILEYYGVENKGYGDISINSDNETVTDTVNSRVYDLRFVPEYKFDEMLANKDANVLQYYTLDSDWNLIIATWSSLGGDVTYNRNKAINYMSVLQKYTTPFEYLMDYYIDIKDDDFINDFAKLAMKSEFIIAVEDNVTTTETTTTTYVEYDDGSLGDSTYNNTITESVNTTIELTYADTWFVKFSKEVTFEAASLQTTSGNLVGTAGQSLGRYKLTSYCYICNDDGSGNFGTSITASGKAATPNHTVAIHASGDPNGLKLGDTIMFNGNVYVVEDTGTGQPGPWLDVYVEPTSNVRGQCCINSPFADGYVEVFRAENVRAATAEDSQIDGTKLINTIANVAGKSTDSTTVSSYSEAGPTKEAVGEDGQSYTVNSVIYTDSIIHTISNEYDTGDGEVTLNEYKFIKLFKDNPNAKNSLKDNWLIRIIQNGERTAGFTDLTKYLLYKITNNKAFKDIDLTDFLERFKYNDFVDLDDWATDISLTETVMDRETFIKAMNAYYNKTGNLGFKKNFASRAGEIYDLGKKYGINPEIIVTFAKKESNFNVSGDNQNFWGLGTPNGASLAYYGSFEEAVKTFADVIKTSMEGSGHWREQMIRERKKEREAANCNSNGYGDPGTLKGYLSIYSDLCGENTKHREGNAGDGGNYYLKVIYGAEFPAKCGNVHKIGVDDYTIQERADYTGWLYEQQLLYWDSIFGEFASRGGGIVQVAVKVHKFLRNSGYTYAQAGITVPNLKGRTIDCSSFVTWVLVEAKVQKFVEGMYQWTSWDFEDNPYGWQRVSASDAKPGDIVAYPGHVEIIAENDPSSGSFRVYNCGGNASIMAAGTEKLPESSNSGFSKSQATIILRVPK